MGLINLIFGNCPSCRLYKELLEDYRHEIERLREERKEEKQDRRNLEDHVFKYVRLIRDNGHGDNGSGRKEITPIQRSTSIRATLQDLTAEEAERKKKYWE